MSRPVIAAVGEDALLPQSPEAGGESGAPRLRHWVNGAHRPRGHGLYLASGVGLEARSSCRMGEGIGENAARVRVASHAELSVEVIAGSQTASAAYPASPVHAVYRYGWVRDGSWCACAMDRVGQRVSAAAWHRWVADVLLRHEHRVIAALQAVAAGPIDERLMLPARFTLDGEEEPPDEEQWPNFQLDCHGHWLWALADHIDRGGALQEPTEAAARLVLRYLTAAAELPCYDCWEEHPGHRHTSTLASIVAGLRDAGGMLGETQAVARAEKLRQLMMGSDHVVAGSLVRHPGPRRHGHASPV